MESSVPVTDNEEFGTDVCVEDGCGLLIIVRPMQMFVWRTVVDY